MYQLFKVFLMYTSGMDETFKHNSEWKNYVSQKESGENYISHLLFKPAQKSRVLFIYFLTLFNRY